VFAHAGGTIPFLASRFAIVDEMNVITGAPERGTFSDALPRLCWARVLQNRLRSRASRRRKSLGGRRTIAICRETEPATFCIGVRSSDGRRAEHGSRFKS
jgi:hypothetical protein